MRARLWSGYPTLPGPVAIGVAAGAASFGAIGLVLALMGGGAPFLAAALSASIVVGLVMGAVAAWGTSATFAERAAERAPVADPGPAARIEELEARASILRHDVRGALSPALMVVDRLLRHDDPVVRRTGEVVVRSVERAAALLDDDKAGISQDATPGGRAAAATTAEAGPGGAGRLVG